MVYQKHLFFAIFLIGIDLNSSCAQQAVVPSGDNANGSGGSVSWTIGQAD